MKVPDSAPAWFQGLQNLQREHGFEPLRVEGELPSDLDGTLYRNVPALFDRFGERCRHWFDADAAIAAIRIHAGRAEGAVRVIRTPGFLREEREGRRLFSGYNTPVRPLIEVLRGESKNWAGTSAFFWSGRLFATCEGSRPIELSPDDLATLGVSDLEGVIVHRFSAHPHFIAEKDAHFNFGTGMGKDTVVTSYVLPSQGEPRRLAQFAIPGSVMLHDFAVTPRHLIFIVPPFRLRLLTILLGFKGIMDSARWKPQLGTEIVVVPLADPDRLIRFSTDVPFLCEHVINAREERGVVHVDFTRYADVNARERYLGRLHTGRVDGPLGASIARATIDVVKKKVELETRIDAPFEFPQHQRYFNGFSSERARDGFMDTIAKIDIERGEETDRYVPGGGRYPSEAVFVPRSGANGEDDGWLLTLVFDANANASRLEILDARDLARGPVGSAWFDHPIPLGFHGIWVPS